MKVLVVFAHPDGDSLNAAVLERVRRGLGGAEIRVRDLYGEAFDPVLTLPRYTAYNDPAANRSGVEDHAADIEWADALIFVYPTWWYGLPAILKGWLERVLVPGVALKVDAKGKPAGPKLANIRVFGAVSTYGAPWWWTRLIGDPGRRTLMRGVKWLCIPSCRTFWIAQYNIHRRSRPSIEKGLARIESRLRGLVARGIEGEKA